jgi:ribonuclease J
MGFDDIEKTAFDGILLTHAHVDHHAYIQYLRPEIPIYCSEATRLILQAIEDTTSGAQDYIKLKEKFQIERNESGQLTRGKGEEHNRTFKTFKDSKNFEIGSIKVEPLEVDHSIPGVTAFILQTSDGSIGYTADIRFHGRRADKSHGFAERCGESDIDILLCEGTRISELSSESELKVEADVKDVIKDTDGLVTCTYPIRDLDRMLSFYNAAKESQRDLIIDLKQAYLLKLFQGSENLRNAYPRPDDSKIRIYIPRKKWGLIGKDLPNDLVLQDYYAWEEEFINQGNAVDYTDIRQRQSEFVFYCNDFQLDELIDIEPSNNSSYIRSSTEPFDEEMELDERRVKRWLEKFGLIWHYTHVSGHGSGDQLKQLIEKASAKKIVPIHTEKEEYYKRFHASVQQVELNQSIILQ